MKYVMIAPAGPLLKNILPSFETFPVTKVYLITPKKYEMDAEKMAKELEKRKVAAKIMDLDPNYWENFIMMTRESVCVKSEEGGEEKGFIMHTDTGDAELRTIATTAAFLNGIKALSFDGGETRLLPLFNLTYQTKVTEKKMQILKVLEHDITCCKSFEELSRKTKMSLPLISYHINGNLKSAGLRDLGLVQTHEENGRINVNLSSQGLLLLKGYLKEPSGNEKKGETRENKKAQASC